MFREEQRRERRVLLWARCLQWRMQPTGEGWTVVQRGEEVVARGCQMEMLSYTSVPLFKSDILSLF